jgi:hypothetical protein
MSTKGPTCGQCGDYRVAWDCELCANRLSVSRYQCTRCFRNVHAYSETAPHLKDEKHCHKVGNDVPLHSSGTEVKAGWLSHGDKTPLAQLYAAIEILPLRQQWKLELLQAAFPSNYPQYRQPTHFGKQFLASLVNTSIVHATELRVSMMSNEAIEILQELVVALRKDVTLTTRGSATRPVVEFPRDLNERLLSARRLSASDWLNIHGLVRHIDIYNLPGSPAVKDPVLGRVYPMAMCQLNSMVVAAREVFKDATASAKLARDAGHDIFKSDISGHLRTAFLAVVDRYGFSYPEADELANQILAVASLPGDYDATQFAVVKDEGLSSKLEAALNLAPDRLAACDHRGPGLCESWCRGCPRRPDAECVSKNGR